MVEKSNVILTGGADATEVLRLIDNDIESNYYTDREHLLNNEADVKASDIRQFKITITVEEINK